jgi:ribose transport system substrate-binding protein
MGLLQVKRRAVGAAGLSAVIALVAAGCGSSNDKSNTGTSSAASGSNSGSVSVDVGNGKPIEFKKGQKLRLGLFLPGSGNQYMKSYTASGLAEAKKLGLDVKVYDPAFNATTQVNQMQNAIQQKAIDLAVVHAADGTVTCNAVTKSMPAANILVNAVIIPQCDTGTSQTGKSGDELWVPGMLNFVGSNNTLGWNVKWFEAAAKANPGPQKAALILGQATGGQSRVIQKALKLWQTQNPGSQFKVIDTVNTDYSAPDTFKKTQSYLQAHPDVNVLMVASSPDQTQGAVKAVDQAGKAGKVKIINSGGDPYSIDGIKKGSIQLTMPQFPTTSVKLAIDSVVNAARGTKQPKFVDDSASGGNSIDNPLITTKANVDQAPSGEYGG